MSEQVLAPAQPPPSPAPPLVCRYSRTRLGSPATPPAPALSSSDSAPAPPHAALMGGRSLQMLGRLLHYKLIVKSSHVIDTFV